MELDDLKTAWKALDERLQTQTALNVRMFKDGKLDKLRRSLRPLAWGQVVQIVFGSACILLGAGIWSQYASVTHLLVAGILVHLSGVSMLAMGVLMQIAMSRIDYGAPVLEIQRQLARVRTIYVRGGLIVGLQWWFIWIAYLMVVMAYAGVDLYKHAPGVAWYGVAIGAAGLAVTWVFHRWSRRPGRERIAEQVDAYLAGTRLTRAQGMLDEVAQFEKE